MFAVSTGYILWETPLQNGSAATNGESSYMEAGSEQAEGENFKIPTNALAPSPGTLPNQTAESIRAISDDVTEPSPDSENQYILAVRDWLNSLEPEKREIARKIMLDAHPVLHNLRKAISEKKAQLATISFGPNTKPEALTRIGVELQKLRFALQTELEKLKSRLASEAGVDVGLPGNDIFWLTLPASKKKWLLTDKLSQAPLFYTSGAF